MERIDNILIRLPKMFLSFGAMWVMITAGNSLNNAKQYEMEVAEYKLTVGSVLSDVKKEVNSTLEKTAATSTIAPEQKREIEQLTEKTNAVIEKVAEDIEGETEKFIDEKKE